MRRMRVRRARARFVWGRPHWIGTGLFFFVLCLAAFLCRGMWWSRIFR